MKRDAFTPSKKDLQDPLFTGFLDAAAARMNNTHPTWDVYDSTTGVLND